MEKILERSLLYDFYGELLTEHQKEIYEDFVHNDLSLAEIAEEREISRQGVYDIVKRCNRQLTGYEGRLHLVEKFLAAKARIEEIHHYANQILSQKEDPQVTETCIKAIETISRQIIDEM